MTLGTSDTREEAEYDIFRDSPVRLLGYTNEVGESFRYQFPKLVTPTYIVSFGYCLMDASNNGYNAWTKFDATKTDRSQYTQTALAAADVMLWQTLASVMIPGAVINMVVKASRFAVKRAPPSLPKFVAAWLPTTMGLASVPLIIDPIDHGVDFLLDRTARKWMAEEKVEKS